MKKLLFFTLLLLVYRASFAQLATFDWKVYTSFTNPSSIASDGNRILCAFKNGMLTYDIESKEMETWSYSNYLSDVEISQVYYDPNSKTFWIGYVNGNIDVLQGNTLINLPSLKLASIIGSKKINSFTSHNGKIYAVADFGILVIDPKKLEIKETYYTNQDGDKNLQIAFLGDSIFSLTPKELYGAKANNVILSDFNQWKKCPMPPLDSVSAYSTVTTWNQQLVFGRKTDGFNNDSLIFYKNGVITHPIQDVFELSDIKVIDNRLCVVHFSGAKFYQTNYEETERFFQYTFSHSPNAKSIVKTTDGDYYFADNTYGLVQFTNNWSNHSLTPEGPARDLFYRAKGRKGKMIFGGGAISRGWLSFNRPAAYTLDEGAWKYFSKTNIKEIGQKEQLWDFNAVDIHPKNSNKIAIGGSGIDTCLFILEDGKVIEQYGSSNSLLKNNVDGDTSFLPISDVAYDKKGNLWILNAFTTYPLKVLTADGVWYQFNTGSQTGHKFVDHLTFDEDGNPWFVVDGVGICGLFYNGTFTDSSDDRYKIINDGDFTGKLPSNDVTDIIPTKDGRFWITTAQGFSILNNPTSVKDATAGNYNTFRPKVQYGENTEYFFGDTYLTCGITDGGNRKWVGTMSAGLFCLSEDGYSILQEYNTANSHLISNNIIDLAFDDKTGELFVITDLGLESIRVDASEGTNDYKTTTVFPNPVLPEYSGVITIQGIKADSDVKITDVAGNLVYKTSSNGGTAVWDGKKVNGEQVASGVYLIWTAPKEGKGRKVGSVTVIR